MNLGESISSSVLAKRMSSSRLTLVTPLPLDFCPGVRDSTLPSLQDLGGLRLLLSESTLRVGLGSGFFCHTSVFCFGTVKTLRR